MRHADWLIERILFLGGLPNAQRLNPVRVGQSVEEILRADLGLEKAMEDLREGIAHCEGVRDYVSRGLLRRILGNEEAHVDFLDRQFDLIRQVGVERYFGQESDAGVSARAMAAAMSPEEGMAVADAGAWDLASAVKRLTE